VCSSDLDISVAVFSCDVGLVGGIVHPDRPNKPMQSSSAKKQPVTFSGSLRNSWAV
jgi:hypothetical protein